MNTPETLTAPIPATVRLSFFREAIVSAGNLYCRLFHRSISRPVDGKYQCWQCLRTFELDW